jgi:hypothetical protein
LSKKLAWASDVATQILGPAYRRSVLSLSDDHLTPGGAIQAIGETLQRCLFMPGNLPA